MHAVYHRQGRWPIGWAHTSACKQGMSDEDGRDLLIHHEMRQKWCKFQVEEGRHAALLDNPFIVVRHLCPLLHATLSFQVMRERTVR